jgi:hypothetical protein
MRPGSAPLLVELAAAGHDKHVDITEHAPFVHGLDQVAKDPAQAAPRARKP